MPANALRAAPGGPAGLVWPTVLGATAILGSYGFACVFPFVAMAMIAALTMNLRRALGFIGLVWFANQVVGYLFRAYPRTLDTAVLGVSLLLASVAALIAARIIIGAWRGIVGMIAAFAAAFSVFEAVLFPFAIPYGGIETFGPAIVARVAANDAAWLIALWALHRALRSTMPRWFPRAVSA